MDKIKIRQVVLVEGKYDKIKLSDFIDGTIMTTNGFSVFNNEEKCIMLRRIAKERGIVILTDSDGAGFVIRNKLRGIIGSCENIINLYIPNIAGKEKRKNKASKQGYLGVEGIDTGELKSIFEKAGLCSTDNTELSKETYSKIDLYNMGLSGHDDSSKKRAEICRINGLPESLTANAFLEALNILKIKIWTSDKKSDVFFKISKYIYKSIENSI